MASYAFRKVNCVDPCDPSGILNRQLALLVQSNSAPLQADTNIPSPLYWLPEPILANPVKIIDKITADTVIQSIQVIDPVFGNQIVQYITNIVPKKCFNTSNNKEAIKALWEKSIPAPPYTPGLARASLHFTPGEVKLDGSRSDFTTSYNLKYPPTTSLPASDIPIYCHCRTPGNKSESSRRMIQCSNEERYCVKEWYHIKCIGMAAKDVPPGDNVWFCEECVEGRLGRLKEIMYVPWKREGR